MTPGRAGTPGLAGSPCQSSMNWSIRWPSLAAARTSRHTTATRPTARDTAPPHTTNASTAGTPVSSTGHPPRTPRTGPLLKNTPRPPLYDSRSFQVSGPG